MKDLLEDVYVQAGMMSFPGSVSFTEHILPILSRQTSLQWANKGFAAQFGWGGTACADNLEWIAKLSSPGDTWAELRQQVANSFRRYERDGTSPQPWPWLYGDAMDVPPANTPRQHSTLTRTQLRMLEHWAAGRFTNDWDPTVLPPVDLEKTPLSLQPTMLDEAAMDNCLADAFHPGCELTWPMRHATLFRAPFRIREASAGAASTAKYGAQLTQESALSIDGPLYAQTAGDLTRWMAVPWQTDTASCRGGYYAGYGPRYDPYLPTFWPARVPNQVLTEEAYQRAIDPGLGREERISAFAKRESWFRTLGPGGYESQINRMISNFADMGIIESRPGIPGDKDLPPVMQVENRVAPDPAAGAAHAPLEDHIEPFNSENEASLRTFRAIGGSEQ
ncbi:LodA/GoxA family CTQ-dependent oxidase [Hydrogenophaga sp.]|jgi:hypothetical protein|uniref:LodA/GoxA family CTQ-dependent oxidase n=1 Tax=Hydrogenophaga sp. TaxID=1904254 RepID=UPI0025BCD340|nr:LodA/GoxA family CTQ-dependent oxidase [Hydrogenophaga sp.]